MGRYRGILPQLSGELYLTDGGIETTLIFHEGLELPDFAAFDLLKRPTGQQVLRKYFRTYGSIARKFRAGLILESATWRANPDWAFKIGYTREELAEANRKAIELLEEVRAEIEDSKTHVVISGCVGPRGDGYVPERVMSPAEAQAYHAEQIETFADTAADMITAITMNYAEEAVGVALAAKHAQMPVAVSFTVETDGRLATGQTLRSAIEQVDEATALYPAYYMINCAHPSHFVHAVVPSEEWTSRIRGVRANASRKSHAELSEATELDAGDPEELALQHRLLKDRLAKLNVIGGCCGTDHRHVERIAAACAPLFRRSTLA